MSSRPVDEALRRRVARPPRPGGGQAAALLVVVLLLAAIPGRVARSAAGEGKIDVSAPPRCGTGAATELGRRVTQRSPRVHLSPDGDRATMVRVSIEPGPGEVTPPQAAGTLVATLTVWQGAAAPWSRRVHTTTCDEALDALALILALTLDPERAQRTPGTSGAPPPSGTRPRAGGRGAGQAGGRRVPTAGVDTGTPPAPAVPEGASLPAPMPDASVDQAAPRPAIDQVTPRATVDVDQVTPRPPSDQAPVVAVVRPSSWHWSGVVGAAGAMTTVPAPSVMPGAAIYLWLGADRGALWSPAVRLAVAHFWASRFDAGAGTARFTADLANLDLCPLWWRRGAWGLGGCAAVTAGLVTGQGTDSFAAQTRRRPFLAPGGSVAFTFEPPPVGRVQLQLAAWVNGAVPVFRDRFQFLPDVFYRVPLLSLTAGVAVGWRFW